VGAQGGPFFILCSHRKPRTEKGRKKVVRCLVTKTSLQSRTAGREKKKATSEWDYPGDWGGKI